MTSNTRKDQPLLAVGPDQEIIIMMISVTVPTEEILTAIGRRAIPVAK